MDELPPANPKDLDALDRIDTADQMIEELAKADPPPLERLAEPQCRHLSVRLVPNTRRVFCRECEREVDPFTALVNFTNQWDRYQRQLRQVKVDTYLKKIELADLKREEKRARARQKKTED